ADWTKPFGPDNLGGISPRFVKDGEGSFMACRLFDRPSRLAFLLILALTSQSSTPARAQKPFAPPKDRASWDGQREALRGQLVEALGRGLPDPPKGSRLEVLRRGSRPGLLIEHFSMEIAPSTDRAVEGVLVLPEGSGDSRRVPLVVLVQDSTRPATEVIDKPGLDDRPPAITLAKFGFASLAINSVSAGAS